MKISFNRNIIDGPYGGGNAVMRHLKKHFEEKGISVVHTPEKCDYAIMFDVRDESCSYPISEIETMKKSGAKIIHRINENDAHRPVSLGLDEKIVEANKLADNTVFVSSWLQRYFERKGLKAKNPTVIMNGSDRTRFHGPAAKHFSGKPIKIVTHHWSSNPYKGFWLYSALDYFCHEHPDIAEFTYIGNWPEGSFYHCRRLRPRGHTELPDLLRRNHIWVTATKNEPGSNSLIEAMSCGLIPIYMLDTGSCSEYAKDYGILCTTPESLFNTIMQMQKNFGVFLSRRQMVQQFKYSAIDMCKHYMKVITDAS